MADDKKVLRDLVAAIEQSPALYSYLEHHPAFEAAQDAIPPAPPPEPLLQRFTVNLRGYVTATITVTARDEDQAKDMAFRLDPPSDGGHPDWIDAEIEWD